MIADTNDGYVPSPPGTPLRVYLLTQGVVCGYDTYDSCVVIAANKEDARRIHPRDMFVWGTDEWYSSTWVSKDEVSKVNVIEIGMANDKQVAGTVVCSSYNAG